MAESKVKAENYITICGWMITQLGLKGTELLVYACIYGFCQAEGMKFNGGLKYLIDWTGTSKNTVLKSLKSLEDKKIISKQEKSINGIKLCEYSIIEPVVQKLNRGGAETEPNNIYNNNIYNNYSLYINNIIHYLNIILGSKYKPGVQKTRSLITARLNEGFTEEDFKTVIDWKCKEWKGTEMEKYLRPETLFGTKFEGYLNSAPKKKINNDDLAVEEEIYEGDDW